MQLSAEIRWFREGTGESAWSEWFASTAIHDRVPFSDTARTDAYLLDTTSTELGIKRRQGKPGTELKCLISQTDTHELPSVFRGAIQLWGKWTSTTLDVSSFKIVNVTKQRLLRKFEIRDGIVTEQLVLSPTPGAVTPARSGCGAFLELTSITHHDGSLWTSIGLESYGSLGELSDSLQLVAEHLFSLDPPTLHDWMCASYPQWLTRYSTIDNVR